MCLHNETPVVSKPWPRSPPTTSVCTFDGLQISFVLVAPITLDRAGNPKALRLREARVSWGVGHPRRVVLCFTGLAHDRGRKQFVDSLVRQQKRSLWSLVTILFLVVEGEDCAEAGWDRDLVPKIVLLFFNWKRKECIAEIMIILNIWELYCTLVLIFSICSLNKTITVPSLCQVNICWISFSFPVDNWALYV